MKIAICEDEEIFQKQLCEKIKHYYQGKKVEISFFSSGEALIKSYEFQEHYDVVFLDIEMKKLTGVETAKKIRTYDYNEMIIFLTSHQEYALEGYEVKAMRFLVKPINDKKLEEALEEAEKNLNKRQTILLHHSEGETLINIEEILYCEAQRNDLHFVIGKQRVGEIKIEDIKVRMTLGEIESRIKEEGFFKCHRSYLVNIKWIASYGQNEIQLEDGTKLPMSRGKIKELQKYLMEHI